MYGSLQLSSYLVILIDLEFKAGEIMENIPLTVLWLMILVAMLVVLYYSFRLEAAPYMFMSVICLGVFLGFRVYCTAKITLNSYITIGNLITEQYTLYSDEKSGPLEDTPASEELSASLIHLVNQFKPVQKAANAQLSDPLVKILMPKLVKECNGIPDYSLEVQVISEKVA